MTARDALGERAYPIAVLTKLKREMVVDVDLNPTKGSETGKIRPCIVVTNNTYNERVPVIKYELIIYWSESDQAFIVEVPELPG